MSVTINSGSTPPLATVQADLLKLVEILNRGCYPATVITPATITTLASLGNTANGTTSIVLS